MSPNNHLSFSKSYMLSVHEAIKISYSYHLPITMKADRSPAMVSLKVVNTLDLNALKLYYKYLHGKLPSYFYSFNIVTQGSQHTYNTRQSEQIRTECTQAEYCDNRLRIYLPGLVNSVPLHLLERIATHSIQGFSFGIKYHFLNSYPTECSIVNCYICHRNQR